MSAARAGAAVLLWAALTPSMLARKFFLDISICSRR